MIKYIFAVILVMLFLVFIYLGCNENNERKEKVIEEPPPWIELKKDQRVPFEENCKTSNYGDLEKMILGKAHNIIKDNSIRVDDLKEEICLTKGKNSEGKKFAHWAVHYLPVNPKGPGGGWSFYFTYPDGKLKSFYPNQ